jgi:hypothetical protein
MYKIIGNDGKTYGPVNADKIREWIGQGRVDHRTPVLGEGATEWTYIGLLPEFSQKPPTVPPALEPPRIAPLPTRENNGFATAGFICGLLSLTVCCCCYGFPFNILGLVFSIIALVQLNGQTPRRSDWGLALAGLICSGISLLLGMGLGTIAALTPTAPSVTWHIGSM